MTGPGNEDPAGPAPLRGCLLQVAWTMLGPGLVLVAGLTAAFLQHPVGSENDWLLLVAVAGSIAARFLDPTPHGRARPDEDPPLGPWMYAAWVAGAGAVLFALAHFVAPRVL